MKTAIPHLINWFELFLRHKDSFTKKIQEIEKNDNHIAVTYQDNTKHYYLFLTFDDFDNSLIKDNTSLVFLNTEKNFEEFIKIWPKMIEHKGLCVYFVNPFAQGDKKWIIFPHTHHQISDSESLKTGLKSMFDTVEPITVDDFKKKSLSIQSVFCSVSFFSFLLISFLVFSFFFLGAYLALFFAYCAGFFIEPHKLSGLQQPIF